MIAAGQCLPLSPQSDMAGLERTENVVNVECDVQFIAQCSQPKITVGKDWTFVPAAPAQLSILPSLLSHRYLITAGHSNCPRRITHISHSHLSPISRHLG